MAIGICLSLQALKLEADSDRNTGAPWLGWLVLCCGFSSSLAFLTATTFLSPFLAMSLDFFESFEKFDLNLLNIDEELLVAAELFFIDDLAGCCC